MNHIARAEYVALRLLRRFVFSERVANLLARWLPYYRPSVNETRPGDIVAAYTRHAQSASMTLTGKRILEVGAGRTNVVGYSLAAAGAAKVVVLEPFVAYDAALDTRLLRHHHGDDARTHDIVSRVRRVRDFGQTTLAGIDLVLSNSVLEHVTEPAPLFTRCMDVLADDGAMIHVVDYRDHFFKYPYAFLTFSDRTWSRWLDPGDLPRWRLGDHVAAMQQAGFAVEVIDREVEAEAFERIRDRLTPRFAGGDPDVAVATATLLARKRA